MAWLDAFRWSKAEPAAQPAAPQSGHASAATARAATSKPAAATEERMDAPRASESGAHVATETPHIAKPAAPARETAAGPSGPASAAAAATAAPKADAQSEVGPHRTIVLPDEENWQLSSFGQISTIHVQYIATPGAEPVQLEIQVNKQNQWTHKSFSGEAGANNRRAFEASIAELLQGIEEKDKLPKDWQSLQLSLNPDGKLHNLTVFRPGKTEAVDVDGDDGQGAFSGMLRRMVDLWKGKDTVIIRKQTDAAMEKAQKERAEKEKLERERERQAERASA